MDKVRLKQDKDIDKNYSWGFCDRHNKELELEVAFSGRQRRRRCLHLDGNVPLSLRHHVKTMEPWFPIAVDQVKVQR